MYFHACTGVNDRLEVTPVYGINAVNDVCMQAMMKKGWRTAWIGASRKSVTWKWEGANTDGR